ncbi:MAG: hypothetical protein JWM98_2555 [Thermoleophilia bacterium]|nr:hypothetical protein [Thermoleophilia bacterium]
MAQVHTTTARRLSTETKHSSKTTELYAYVVVFVGILIASKMIDGNGDKHDNFQADEAWRYITWLTIGYLVSRGLAKSGSREPFWDEADHSTTRTDGGTNRL